MEEATSDIVSQVFSAGRLATSLTLVALTWIALRAAEAVVGRVAAYLPRRRQALNRVLPVMRIMAWSVLAYVIVARVLAPPREMLLAVAASAGLAVGLAAQDLVRNLISGLLMLFEQSFQVGDGIVHEGVRGEVVAIGLRSTRVHTADDLVMTIPNGKLMESAIGNATRGALRRQVSVTFALPGHVDVIAVKRLAIAAAQNSPYTWLSGNIDVFVEDEFDRSFLTRYTLRVSVIDLRLQAVFESDLVERIKREVVRRGWVDEALVLSSLGAGAAAPPLPEPH